MPSGFFAKSLLIQEAPATLIPKCGSCGLFKNCNTPKMPYAGKGRRGILIVGEFPSDADDEIGKHFSDDAGAILRETLRAVGVDMRTDCWYTNALICAPHVKFLKEDVRSVDFCRPNLKRTIEELKPTTIILLGGPAVRALIGDIWRENPGDIDRWVGWNIPDQKYNTWICPTYSPSYVKRQKDAVLELYFKEHLRKAVEHSEKPWEKVPDWESRVEVILDTDKAAEALDWMEEQGGTIGYDYENTCLKPEYEGGEIICVSACWEGKRTISTPWHGRVIKSASRLLRSDRCRFIASNLKHEERWTRYVLGHGVRHWAWDTMLAAHTLDNREGICSLKFQAYVHLGIPAYDDHIKKLLIPLKGKKTNSAKQEIDLYQLLRYCGTDSLLEVLLAKKQHKLLGIRNADNNS